ncbi:MAG: ArnT family glycosyltransferase [Candidatus Pacearchaeota archaeon]
MSERIKNWFKSKSNFVFFLVIVFSIILNLYFFSKTASQALWWDEADYMAYAKNLAGFPVDWIVTSKHNSLYPFIAALFFKLGFSEMLVKFSLQLVPAVCSVILSGVIARKMYKDKRVGTIVAFLTSILWVNLFNSTRFHIDILAMFFGLMAVYIFWTGYERKEKIFGKLNQNWAIPLAVLFVVLTYAIRRGYIIFGFFFIAYILGTRKIKDISKDKYNWIGLVLGIVLFLFVESFIFSAGLSSISGEYYHEENKLNFLPLQVFGPPISSSTNLGFFTNAYNPLLSVLSYLFWIGFVSAVIKLFLAFGYIRSSEESKADLFNVFSIVLTLFLFIFVLRTVGSFGEERWYLPLAFSSLIFISKASLYITKFFDNKKQRMVGIVIVSALLLYGGYYELKYSNQLILDKQTSFEAIRDAGLYIKSISSQTDKIIGMPITQLAFYSERSVARPRDLLGINDTNNVPFDQVLQKIKEDPNLKYLIVSFSEPNHPDWMQKIEYVSQNGQAVIASWTIPFTNTSIDFRTGKQDIKQSISYGEITFNLNKIEQEVFIYEIEHG